MMGFFSDILNSIPIVGDVLEFGGNLLGMESDRAVAGQDRQEAQRQFNLQREDNHNATHIRVKDALKAGINPLAALGVSSNVSPTVSAGGSQPGHHMSKAMSALGNMFRSKFRLDKESAELDNEAKRLRNDVIRTELNHLRQPGLPVNGGAQLTSSFRPDGRKMLYDVAYDLNGRPRLMVNQDVTENDSDNAGYRSALATAFASGQINPLTGRVRSRQLQMLIDDMYHQSTGRHITNLDELYISPAEFGFAAADEIQAWMPGKGKK